ncbi:MAG: Hsp20/alpha crystallin family protein [Nitrospinae bacterium]|nr:Hsp20/alpha crystallin family protein [Nitrospinota bacterium]
MLLTKRDRNPHPLAEMDPFGALSLIDELWPSAFLATGDRPYSPAMDVTETDTAYTLRVETPGMEKGDIKIEFENGVLTVSGEKKIEKEEKGEKVHRIERRYGSFCRSLRLTEVDGEKITAGYKDGVLEINVPKTEKILPKRISIE